MGRPRAAALLFCFTVALAAPRARADGKQACVTAYEKAQQLRIDAKLRAAKDQLTLCSRPECPAIIRQDCAQWMGEVNASLPSVVIAGKDGAGHDVLDVRVTLDGVVVADKLDGRPITVDPGPHKLKYETRGKPAVEEQILVREGERARPLTVTFAASPSSSPPPPPDAAGAKPIAAIPSDEPPPPKPSSSVALPVTLIVVGAVALGAALFFDLKATGDAQTLRDVCSPNCKQSDVDAVSTKYVAAGISLGVGIVGVGLGTALLLLRPAAHATTSASAAPRGWTFDVAPSPGGAAASFKAAF